MIELPEQILFQEMMLARKTFPNVISVHYIFLCYMTNLLAVQFSNYSTYKGYLQEKPSTVLEKTK